MGYIEGGWEYVGTAYVLTAVVLAGYATSVIWRLRSERRKAEREGAR